VQLDVDELVSRMRGRVLVPDGATTPQVVDGLAIDSRLVRPGQLFAALRAERDGHDFVPAAFEQGASWAVVDRRATSGASLSWPGPVIEVDSVADSLVEVARAARLRLPDRVVGVTGSVGKTTTKDLLANVLARRFSTVASERSFNNELGVPITLANAPDETEAAVVEMGARGVGHIRYLCEMARPTVGVVTVIEGVHTEVMGGIDQIALVKRELIEDLPADGAAILNVGDPLVAAMASHTRATVVSFGGSGSATGRDDVAGDVHATGVVLDAELRPGFVLRSSWGSIPVQLGVRGAHNVTNALAAAATALWLGVDLADVAAGLADPPASPWRMELVETDSGLRVLNDAYNAGPASMAAALRAVAAMPLAEGGRRVAVLGMMAELGDEGPDAHRRIAELAGELGVRVLSVGCDLYGVGDSVRDVDQAVSSLGGLGLGPTDVVLVKGSRVAGLERVAEALTRPGRS